MIKLYAGKVLPFLLLLASINFHLSAQISTIAGRHTYLGDNGLATSAGLFGPYSFTRDSTGNIYIATYEDNRVRKIDAATNIITTIAGTGIAGYSGDGGLATAAQLKFNNNGLPGIAVDKTGNVYIGDFLNNRIRRIDAVTNIITTIAGTGTGGTSADGTAAVSAKISNPAGIVIDATGNIYFCDNGNNLVRRIDAVSKNIYTVAPATVFGYPECLALDKKSNLYVSDEFNSIIRKIDATTQAVTTVAGTGVHGFSGDGAAATSAALGYTMGVTVDTTGNIYIADQDNNRIRKVDAVTLKISTVCGTGVAGYSGDGGLASSGQVSKPTTLQSDKAGNVYIDDFANNRIRVINALSKIITTVAGDGSDGFTGAPYAYQAQLTPQALTLDASGNVYIAEGNYYDVRIVAPGNYTYNYAGKPNPDFKFASKGYSGNGNLASAALYNAPFGVAVDASNNVYIADVFNNVIRKVTYSTKYVSTIAGTSAAGFAGDGAAATSALLNNPYGIAVDKNGNLYIADANNNRVRKITAATQVITTVAGNGTAGNTGDGGLATAATLNSPRGMAIDTGGNVFILDRGNNQIRMVTAATQKISTVFSNSHALTGVAVDVTGNIFVSDSTAGTIIRLDAKTYTANVVAGTGTPGYSGDGSAALSAQLNYPGGLFVNSAGNIYVADINNYVVRKIIPAAILTPIKNNVITTADSVATCTGKINLTTLNGALPTSGAGTYTYKWLQSPDSINYTAIAGATAQNYTIGAAITTTTYYRRLVNSGTYTDSGNVIGFHIYTSPAPVIATGALNVCQGVKDTLKTTAAFTKYAWSTGAVSSQIIDSISGSFYVTVTDANGCSAKSATVSITVNALPAVPVITPSPLTTTALCPGTTVTLTSSTATTYAWSSGASTKTIAPTVSGSYAVIISDANGCSRSSAGSIVSFNTCGAPSSLSSPSLTDTTATVKWTMVSCAVKYQLQYAPYGTTSWTTVTTSTTDTSYKITGLAKGTAYTWQVAAVCVVSPATISAYSSALSFTTTVTPIKNNVIGTTDSTITCSSKINISTLTGALPSGGSGAYAYKWLQSPDSVNYTAIAGAASQNYTVGAAITTTTYYRRVVSSGTYTPDSSNVIGFHVYTGPAPVINNKGAASVCAGTKDTLSTTLAYAAYLWSSGETSRQKIDSVTTTLTVMVTDGNGCKAASAPVSITVNALPAVPLVTHVPAITTGLCVGTMVSLTSSSGAQYAWNNGATTPTITVNTAGAYAVTVTDGNGCSNTSKLTAVSYNPCGVPANLSATNITNTGATIKWSYIPCAIQYQLQYTLAGSSSWTTVTTTNTDTVYTLTGLAAGTNYQWQVAAVCQASPVVVSNYTGSAFVTATIPVSNNAISTADSVITCTGQINITTLTGTLPADGTGVYAYKWLQSANGITYTAIAGATAQNYTASAAINVTTYYRRLVNSGVYSDSGNVLVFHVYTAPVPVITNTGNASICMGAKDTLGVATAYPAYMWSTGANTSQVVASAAGVFTVMVTDANGCAGTSAPVSITVNALPAPVISSAPASTTNLCVGSTATLTTPAAAQYAWSTGETSAAITVGAAGNYTVTITDNNGCINTSPAVAVSYRACGAPGSLSAGTITHSSALLRWHLVPCAVKYQLQYAPAGSSTFITIITSTADTTYNLRGLAAGTAYQWKVSSICQISPLVASGYTSSSFTTAAATFSLNNVVSTTDSTATCTGKISLKTLTGTLPTGGTGTYTYKWLRSVDSITFTVISGATAQNYAANATITATYYYRRMVTSGAFSDSSNVIGFHVRKNAVPVITATGGLAVCKGVKDTLGTVANYINYTWNTSAVISKIVDTVSASFYVTVTDSFGCTGKSATVAVKVNNPPAKPVITSTPATVTSLCPGTIATLSSTSALHYAWSTGDTMQSVILNTGGSYTVTVKDVNGCTSTSSTRTVSYRACGAPSSLTTATKTGTTAQVLWKSVPCAAKYQLQYALYGTTNWTTIVTTDTTYQLTGLTKSTKYAWQVSTVCQASPLVASAYTSVYNFTTTSAATLQDGTAAPVTVEVSSASKNFDAVIYPNPTVNSARLNISGMNGKVVIIIADLSGRTLWRTELEGFSQQVKLPADRFARGIYFVTISNEKYTKTLKLIKQ